MNSEDRPQITYLERKILRLEQQLEHQEALNDTNRRILKKIISDLEEATRAKADFLANMSHEIRTPLSIMLAMAEILGDSGLDARQHRHLAVLCRSGSQLLDIINNILDFSRIEAGSVSINPEQFGLDALLGELETVFKPLAIAKRLEFAISPEADMLMSRRGDVLKIRQILVNLLNNAIKYTDTGSVTLTVTTDDSSSKTAEVVFKIIDTGLGIDEDKLTSVFERFTRLNENQASAVGGVGLGLAICQKLVTLLGGQIEVASTKGHGTTFTVRLPLPHGVPSAHQPSAKQAGGCEDFRPLSVLVAEDIVENFLVIQHYLQQLPVQLTHVTNGDFALSLLEHTPFDLVLMDIRMPLVDGITATRTLRSRSGPNRDIPVVAITAHAFEEQKNKFLNTGFNDILTKPFSKFELIELLRKHAAGAGTIADTKPEDEARAGSSIDSDLIPGPLLPLAAALFNRLEFDLVAVAGAMKRGNKKKITECCHAITGVAGMYGLNGFSKLIGEISQSIKKGRAEDALESLKRAEKTLEKIKARYCPLEAVLPADSRENDAAV